MLSKVIVSRIFSITNKKADSAKPLVVLNKKILSPSPNLKGSNN